MQYFPFQDSDMNAYSTTDTDWSKVYYDRGYTNVSSLSIRGGSETARYYLSASYFKGQSTIIGNSQERFSTHSGIDLALGKRAWVTFSTTASYNINQVFNPGSDYYEALPIDSPYNPDGSLRLYNKSVSGKNERTGDLEWSTTKFFNSVAEREQNDNNQNAVAIGHNISLEYQILPGLAYTAELGVDYQNVNENIYEARSNWSGMDTSGNKVGYATKNNSNVLSFTGIQRLNYERRIGKSKIGGVVGMEATSGKSNTLSATGSGFVNDKVREVGYASTKSSYTSKSESRSLSYLFQATYNYDDRYFVNINGRADGTSGFGKDSKWGNFGSVGVSWNFHKEKFYPYKFINIFKLKATYGTTGNSRIGTQEALGLYSYSESDNYMGTSGASQSGSPNQNLTWETGNMINLGLRLKFWDRVDVELETYWKRTFNMVTNIDVSRTTGDTRVYRNFGEMLNKGIEANVEIQVLQKKNVDWFLTLNASHNVNRLVNMYNGIEKVMGNYLWREGYDTNTLYLIRWAGVDPRDGAPLWYDASGNLTRTYSTANRVPWKTTSPAVNGGISTQFTYKDFSFSSQMVYQLGGYAFSTFGRDVSSDGYMIMSQNQSINQLDRWQKPGDIASTPKLIWGTSTKSVMNSTRYVYSTTYLKLKNIALKYQVPDKFYKSLGISSCSVTFIADNLGFFTPYGKSNRNSYKQSVSGYPMETTYSLGVDLAF
jgi:TonB-linked SusC/RagA family outer membrane protein